MFVVFMKKLVCIELVFFLFKKGVGMISFIFVIVLVLLLIWFVVCSLLNFDVLLMLFVVVLLGNGVLGIVCGLCDIVCGRIVF